MALNRQRKTANIANIVVTDASGNVVLPAGLSVTGLSTAGLVQVNASGQMSVNTTTYLTTAADWFGSVTTSGTLDWNDVTNTKPGTGYTLLLGNATNGPGQAGVYFHPFNLEFSTKNGSGNVTQMAVAYGLPANELYMRGRYQGNWTSWTRYLNSSNYTAYAPSLTGSGASGTWAISISGNAATASAVAWTNVTSRPTALSQFTNDYGYNRFYDGWITSPGYDANTIGGSKSGFTYSNNAPYAGPMVHFEAEGYGLQLNATYGGSGPLMAFRTRNGDAGSWNPWNAVLASSNFNTYAPTLTGGGASGTWGISISGNAASVTNGVYLTGEQNITGTKIFVTADNTFVNSTSAANQGLTVFQATAQSDAYMTFHIGNDYAAFFGLGGVENDLVWGGWSTGNNRYRILHSANYTSWAPSLTGSGASGTWGISISGNAATATALTSMNISQFTNNSGYVTGGPYLPTFGGTMNGNILMGQATSPYTYYLQFGDNTGWTFRFMTNVSGTPTTRFSFADNGNFTAVGDITAFSDRRVKTNIATITDPLDKVMKLRGVTYNRTDASDSAEKIGVIAQEVLEVLPQVVNQTEDGMYGVSYGNMVAVLIEAVKQQQSQIEDLTQQIQFLADNR